MSIITHEEYVEMQREEILHTAKNIIEDSIDITEGIRFLYSNWREAELPVDTPIYKAIMNIEDDLDQIPKGEERQKYSQDYLQKMDLEEKEILEFFKKPLINLCKDILKKYS